MKSYIIDAYIKTLDELPSKYSEKAPEPKPGQNDVLIDVFASALNFFDILQLQGKYQQQPPFPWLPGVEFAGKISASSPIPKGCNLIPGRTRVFGASSGAFAERLSADWRQIIAIPEGMSYEAASTLFITYPTSYAALVLRAKLQKDEWCLVHAAAGGVGLCAVQIAKALGAKVIATAGTEEKLRVVKQLGGADHALDYTRDGWQKKVLELTGGKGVNVICDPVGMIQPSLKCIAWNGRALIISMNLVLLKNISLMGIFWGAYAKNEQDRIPEGWAALLQLLRQGQLRPVVFEELYQGLESLPKGLKALGSRQTWGKAVVQIKKESHPEKRDAKL
ncbi:MAG: hypothetical protein CYPHOPRED_000228 [Cyphobasidiales sp. Tagirdzhanova-0007]|nr:MAG: hypothetical protein CYPHOPRED_000228 [Cyphobasidiales sp. Tagirdzhanova-0007]